MKLAFLVIATAGFASAEVERIEIRGHDDVGSYERLWGTAYYAIDPDLTVNRAVADIGLAPKNSRGKVEFSGGIFVVRPKKTRGTVFLEIVNRGGPQSLGIVSGASGGGRAPQQWDLGDRFLTNQGFTVVFVGWQFDVPEGAGLGLSVPAVPVEGLVRQSYVENGAGARYNTFRLAYCAADPDEKQARLIFRRRIEESGSTIERERWRFSRNGCTVTLDNGFDPGLYEAIYRAKNPPLAGLGMAAIRDMASYLKYGGRITTLRDNPAALKRIIGYGYSQSGRFLRQFVRDGFNEDERGRAVFDGLMISSAGAGGGSFNHRFAMPGEAGNSVLSILRPVDLPPFTDDGLLAKAEARHVTPRIFYTFSSTEYWARAGSLTHTSADGTKDAPLNPRSRLYFLSGTPHAMGPFPPVRGRYLHYVNFAEQRWVTRALLLDLDAWVSSGTQPPPSSYPTIAKAQLVARESVHFPNLPFMAFPEYMPQVWNMDFGPEFLTRGIITKEPPLLGDPYRVLVPAVNRDGNDLGGIALPEIAAPLGTFTGWNIQLPQLPSLHFLAGLIGSFEPFPSTRAERMRTGDSRSSIEERYSSRDDYLDHVRGAAQQLVRRRLLLEEDIASVLRRAGEMWDAIVLRQ